MPRAVAVSGTDRHGGHFPAVRVRRRPRVMLPLVTRFEIRRGMMSIRA